MEEGHLKVERTVIQVIANSCYNFSKLLRHLTPANEEDTRLLTLSRSNQQPAEAFERTMTHTKKEKIVFQGPEISDNNIDKLSLFII